MAVIGFWQITLLFVLLLGMIGLVGVGTLLGYLFTRRKPRPLQDRKEIDSRAEDKGERPDS